MPPKATPAKKEAKSEESKGEDDGPARIVGPGELDDNGQPRPQDVLELVAARIKLEQSMKNRTELENDNHRLRDALERQAGEQTEIFAYLNKELSIKDKVIGRTPQRDPLKKRGYPRDLISKRNYYRDAIGFMVLSGRPGSLGS